MKTTLRKRQGFTLVELLVVIVIIAALAGLTAPMVLRQRKKADQTQAMSNARQVGMAMFEFESDYGSFPDNSTGPTVITNTGTQLTFGGGASNDHFRQLIAAGMLQSEEVFFAKTSYTKKPDNVFNSTATALAAGECGFGYMMNDTVGFTTSGNSARPLMLAPLLNAASDGSCDPDPFDKRAVVLRLDNSVQSYPIRDDNKQLTLPGGKTLLVTGQDSVWGDNVSPKVVAPSKKGS